ncbi:MAG: iron-containing alcohol dehydrogenase [gamma proteobacterium symbiont of Bathyaustriella thionipta]|nr:iron-containing alcohol dehydrogenase [gamma proteobacterium symbiont of Bathyaustriella thionipta]MCU7951557.1 iron-containing alcohol dehydrogenase [gamma proteobacterium symbiont of Bathyaustriella thionipta]MCU7958153.1 iron-containing alcohol dehydrogenase [gamma proteobacterium symbiont of Bathyaustriella thionipta]MCU7968755.1 iron-containing alcohol dehydrogenase [gamma proteobacterium symbiont of Bathyaustriella thionipta]
MFNQSFSLSLFPRIEFGSGTINCLPEKIKHYGQRILLVTGSQSFYQTAQWHQLIKQLEASQIKWFHTRISGEPSPQYIDSAVKQFSQENIQCVIAIGGGSALDGGKAISGLLHSGDSVMDYLEGVGAGKIYTGPAVPFIAVPTTAGTGSEATKNSVISHISRDGYKKSFRDEQLIPQYAIIDPDLLENCPKTLIAANGMDALTQLMESYLSTKANPFTDALALSGIESVRDSLLLWYHSDSKDFNSQHIKQARASMAYAALISGITLAQVGLGSVHGLASPLGAFFPIPHGIACGTVLAEATRINLEAMKKREPHNLGLQRYARIGRLLCQQSELNDTDAQEKLLEFLSNWSQQMALEPLSAYGVSEADIPRLVDNISPSSMQTNPILLTQAEKEQLVRCGL